MPKIKFEKLSDKVFEALKEMISDFRFRPGAWINVEELAKELGVSRTPVWEAVRRLEQQGLLINVPNRGVFMRELTPEMALELYSVREVLEGMAGRLAARRMDGQVLKQMEKCLGKQRRAIENNDMVGYSRLDYEFHAAIYENCGNAYLQEVLEGCKNKMRPLSTHIEPIIDRLYQDHVEVLEALKAKDPAQTEKKLRKHIQEMIRLIEKSAKTNRWTQTERASV